MSGDEVITGVTFEKRGGQEEGNTANPENVTLPAVAPVLPATSGQPTDKDAPPPPASANDPGKGKSTKGSNPRPQNTIPPEAVVEIEGDGKKKTPKKRNPSAKNPTMQAQVTMILDRLAEQAERTDELFTIVCPEGKSRTPTRDSRPRDEALHLAGRRTQRGSRHVTASHYKKRSPKDGRTHRRRPSPRQPYRHSSRRHELSSMESSSSGQSDVDAQVDRALYLMEPRFSHYKGKHRETDNVVRYRPFAYLEREKQREIMKVGHPEELTFLQHVTGLCAMAADYLDDMSQGHGILTHVMQIIDDYEHIRWSNIRAFSNTVVANVARGKWAWYDHSFIERCRSNHYMRRTQQDDSTWSVPCPRYNRGRCDEQDTHVVGEVIMRHVCSHCALNGYDNQHTLRACNRRKTGSGGSFYKGQADDKKDHRAAKSGGTRSDLHSDSAKN